MNPQWQSCVNPWVKVPSMPLPRIWWVGAMLDSLVFPEGRDFEPFFETPLGEVYLKFCAYIAGEFYRIQFDSRCDLWRLPRGKGTGYKECLEMVSAEAELWVKTWKALEYIESIGQLPTFPTSPGMLLPRQSLVPLWFRMLVDEFELLMLEFYHVGDNQPQRSAQLLGIKQNQNRRLQGLENPFSKPYTRRFVHSAITIAGQDNQFYAELYMPMVRQRMKITAGLKKQSARVFNLNGRMTRQGRRKTIEPKSIAQ
jgi:hypothetical protein